MASDEDPIPSDAIAIAETAVAVANPFTGSKQVAQGYIIDTTEVEAMRWPMSIQTIEKIRRDSQATSMFMGLTVPIRQYPWAIDPNGARDEVVQKFADDVGLPIVGDDQEKPIGRTRNRFNHDDHIFHALLSLLYGHMFFEQQGYIEENAGDLTWRLRKLFPIMPKSIGFISTAIDGGLVSVRQQSQYVVPGHMGPEPIPVTQLVAYVWGKEGANWLGRSMLVPVYRHWLMKDKLLRVDAIKHERTGAGVPIIEAAPGATGTEIQRLDAMAQRYKVGEASGGAIPANTKFRLEGVQGATSDVLASIRYHDEAMAAAFFMEVKTLGQTKLGSRALGETFADLAIPIQNAIAKWYSHIFNAHVIEDWVDWNFGVDENAPRITHIDPTLEDPSVDPEALAAQGLLDATSEVDALASTQVAAGVPIMHLAEDDLRDLKAARAHAKQVIARTPMHRRPKSRVRELVEA